MICGGRVWGCRGRCERRSELFVKIQKKKIFFLRGGVEEGGGRAWGRVWGGGLGWMWTKN